MNLKTPSKTPLDKPENTTNSEHQLPLNLNPEQTGQRSIEWAAGLFEGEGCISHDKKSKSLAVSMSDKDVVQEFARVVGYGNVNGPSSYPSYKKHWKPMYSWKVRKKSEVIRILNLFLPYLFSRRKEKALETLNYYETIN